jgi:hypothetical protein
MRAANGTAEVLSITGSLGAHGGRAFFHQTILFLGLLTSQFQVLAWRGHAIRPFKGRNTMKRLSVFSLSPIVTLGLAVLPSGIAAQQGTLKQQLVGTWTLVSSQVTSRERGTTEQLVNPKGILIFDAGGRYADVAGRSDRPKFKNPGQTTTEELAIAMRGFAANFGTWTVNETDKTLTRHLEAALSPTIEGTDVKSTVSLAGDELNLSPRTRP